jgi:hypothetical protein
MVHADAIDATGKKVGMVMVQDTPHGVLVTTDIKDSMDARGPIGLQHHGEKGQTYKFRNARIREL